MRAPRPARLGPWSLKSSTAANRKGPKQQQDNDKNNNDDNATNDTYDIINDGGKDSKLASCMLKHRRPGFPSPSFRPNNQVKELAPVYPRVQNLK